MLVAPRWMSCVWLLVLSTPTGAAERREEAVARNVVPEVAAAIRAEATRRASDTDGFPLPLASHWNTGRHPRSQGWGPVHQLALIEKGHFILPWFAHPPRDDELDDAAREAFFRDYERSIKQASDWKLPLVFVASQWESGLSTEPYVSLPPKCNPNVIGLDGLIAKQICPFGPVEPWAEIGISWTANSQMRQIQAWYPDPPRVIFLSNNEHARLTWPNVEKSERYLQKYGHEKSDDFKRGVVGDGWIERYRTLQQGMRDGLISPAWRDRSSFVGYGAFGPEFIGRWPGWPTYSLHRPGRICPHPLMWDGGSPSYYTHDWNPSTDYTTWSPQIEFQNLVFMQQETRRLNAEFWLEFSVWDGYDGSTRGSQYTPKREVYRQRGQTYDPERYSGFVQFGMWLLRPRAVREYRGWTFPADEGLPYFMAIVEAVDRVHTDPTLREFWRHGELVPNRTRKHPYRSGIPEAYSEVDRWFLLDADVNPQDDPWALSQTIQVFSLALVILVSSEWHMRRVLLTAQAGFPQSVRFVCCPTCEGCDRPNWTESEAIRDRMTEKPTAFFDQYVDPQYDIWKGGRSKARRFTDRR